MYIVIRCMLIIICAFQFSPVDAQLVYYQDTFKGGVTGGGFNPADSDLPGEIELFIEPGSSVLRALLFVGYYNADGMQRTLILNGTPVELNSNLGFMSSQFTVSFSSTGPFSLSSLIIDVTELLITIPQGNVTVSVQPPLNQPLFTSGNGKYVEYYLLVAYENENMELVNTLAMVNETNSAAVMNYSLANFNPIDTSLEVGLAVHGSHFCNVTFDGSYVSVNSQLVGLIGGKDVNNIQPCSGPTGTFYYQNNELFGLSDDTANVTMHGPDALADISPYITNPNEFEVRFDYQLETSPNIPQSNPIWQLFFAYTSTCEAFETTLTERVKMCANENSVQLEATGGVSTGSTTGYHWWPADNLSCTDCPNPVYSGTESANYHVQIWNNDSCSKTLPVRIDVVAAPENLELSVTAATCSETNGSVSLENLSGGNTPYQYNVGAGWVNNHNNFNNLAPGNYTYAVQDVNGCTIEQPFTIEEENPAHAAFTANPQSGTEPLDVNFYNQSSGTNQYEWTLLDSTFNAFEFDFTFDSAGSYPVQLIAWNNEPHCADTVMATIIVNPAPPDYSHSIFMPTLYNLEIGDFFIETTNVQRVEFEIYNAIGQHIFSTTLDVADGRNEIWNGSRHARGYYFFRIKYWDMQGLEFSERGKVLVVR